MISKSSANRPLLGIGLMLAAMATLPFLDVVAKFLGQQGVPVLQIVWARMFFSALLTLPFAIKLAGPTKLLPNLPLMHTLRAMFLIAATGFYFWGLKFMPIADCLAIFFVQPLIVTMLSPLVLGAGAPLAYTEMIMATAAGWWFFGDFPDFWTFAGVAILIACAIYISIREPARNIEPIRDFEQP